jgi:hypothetical protein
MAALPGVRVIPITEWPARTSAGRSLPPITPVAPAKKTLISFDLLPYLSSSSIWSMPAYKSAAIA